MKAILIVGAVAVILSAAFGQERRTDFCKKKISKKAHHLGCELDFGCGREAENNKK